MALEIMCANADHDIYPKKNNKKEKQQKNTGVERVKYIIFF